MDRQNIINTTYEYPFRSLQNKEHREFPRYQIKRRILIKNPDEKVLTGHALDISRQGLQLRCSAKTAYQLETINSSAKKTRSNIYKIKIALPYMNKLAECSFVCTIQTIDKADEENMRIGLKFLHFDQKSQSRLDHFIENLTY
ncbi:MAG: PilZ domain-containing protein [Gammaproteobacteria bacterium]